MPALCPPYDHAWDELLAFVRDTYEPLGIVVSGSIVRGDPGPNSDFDVYVLHAHPWRLRDQRVFAGVPAEIFVNPPDTVRRLFASEHAAGRPTSAHMIATGVIIEPIAPAIAALAAEARDWLARPLEPSDEDLTRRRYSAVDRLDDARDLIEHDPASAQLQLAEAVREIVAYAFWVARRFQPRRKDTLAALAGLDPVAADLVRAWSRAHGPPALAAVEALAQRVLGVDRFFAWTSSRAQ